MTRQLSKANMITVFLWERFRFTKADQLRPSKPLRAASVASRYDASEA